METDEIGVQEINVSDMGPYIRDAKYKVFWQNTSKYFKETLYSNDFGHVFDVCDRPLFKKDLKVTNGKFCGILISEFPNEDVSNFKLCDNCWNSVKNNMSRSNGFRYPPKPTHLLPLDPITEGLVSPRLPSCK
jgi:hypothetical protein